MSEGLADYEGSSCCHKYDRKKKHKYHHHSDSDSDSSSDSDSDSDDDWAHRKNKKCYRKHDSEKSGSKSSCCRGGCCKYAKCCCRGKDHCGGECHWKKENSYGGDSGNQKHDWRGKEPSHKHDEVKAGDNFHGRWPHHEEEKDLKKIDKPLEEKKYDSFLNKIKELEKPAKFDIQAAKKDVASGPSSQSSKP